MLRFLRAILVALVLVQTSMASIGAMSCANSCPDDDPAGECAPLCKCSTCDHPSFRSSLPSTVELVSVPPRRDLAGMALLAPALRAPADEILHVPKTRLLAG